MDPDSLWYWKKPLTVAEMLEAFENMPNDVPIPSDVYLTPPQVAVDTDEDSGDEEDMNPNNFSKKQLECAVEIRFDDLDMLNETRPSEENETSLPMQQVCSSIRDVPQTSHSKILVRFGYKAWVAASRLGYCIQFDLYQGRNQQRNDNLGLGESVVINFAKKIKQQFPETPFSFYFDNFFTGPNLISALNRMDFIGTGTVRENRLKNIEMKNKKMFNKNPRGSYETFVDVNNEIVLTRWKNNQSVSLLSNFFGEHPVGRARKYVHSERRKMDIPQPYIVKMYNRNMGGVDLLDRHISNYRMNIRGKKFYMPVILWMLDLAVVNAWSLSKQYDLKMDQLEFRRFLARALLMRYGTLPAISNLSRKNISVLPKGAHVCVKAQARRRCKYCHSQTIYMCSTCDIALHTKCAVDYHLQLK